MRLFLTLLILLTATFSFADVTTQSGVLRGVTRGDTTAYLGVAFATPPVGALRWKPPVPVHPWRGVREAKAFAPACAQLPVAIGKPTPIGSEDCLYLNVWVPNGKPADRYPVMVFIHGGGLMMGAASDSLYDGQLLAERGKVVVVTIQYRLAELGYLAHPALSEESAYGGSGNYGLMDQLAALRWVQDNITGFQGDRTNVTLFGESAGAASTCSLLSSPKSTGLFARVILESMSCPAVPLALAETEGVRVAARVGCKGSPSAVAACLRAKPLSQLLDIPPTKMFPLDDFRRTTSQLNVDNEFLPELPLEAIRRGHGQKVPMMIGNNASEGMIFIPVFATPAALKGQISKFYGAPMASVIYSIYPRNLFLTDLDQAITIFGDHVFDCRVRRLAQAKLQGDASPVYRYYYNYKPIVNGLPVPALHAAELPFVFQHAAEMKGGPLSAEDLRVERLFLSYWTQFARTGNPNGAGTPLWGEYRADEDNSLVLNASPGLVYHRNDLRCDLWDALDPR